MDLEVSFGCRVILVSIKGFPYIYIENFTSLKQAFYILCDIETVRDNEFA